MSDPRYSLIIPAHDEAKRIGTTLTGYLDAFFDSEVLLVLNGCTDDTEGVARRIASAYTNLRILRIDYAVGKGGAVRAGFLAARAPVVGYVDADGATAPQEMRRLFESLNANEDAVIASRWSEGAQIVVAQPLLRRVAGRVFNAVVRLLFGLPYHDTQCGAKVFSSEALRRISSSLEISNFAFDIDLLYSLQRNGAVIREVPTRWLDMGGSRINLPRASLEMLLAVLRLRLRHSLFAYVIPLFDRIWPTRRLHVRHGLSILIVGLRDPESPNAGESERYFHKVGAGMVRKGHRVEWLSAAFAGAKPTTSIDGVTVKRVGNLVNARAAIPLHYVRKSRGRFDVVVEVQSGIPLLSPLFSLKPKVCLATKPVAAESRSFVRQSIVRFNESLRMRILRAFYRSSRFIAISAEHADYLKSLGIDDKRIAISLEKAVDVADAAGGTDSSVRTFLDAIYAEVSRDTSSYVLDGAHWAIVPHRPRLGITANGAPSNGATSPLLDYSG